MSLSSGSQWTSDAGSLCSVGGEGRTGQVWAQQGAVAQVTDSEVTGEDDRGRGTDLLACFLLPFLCPMSWGHHLWRLA